MIPADPLRNLGPASILRADARTLPLADNSVDLVITSPPYFALRSYQDAGEHYAGQLGSEATPAEFVDALIACTREMVRVVKPSGSIWVNLGDKYAGSRMDGSSGWESAPLDHDPKKQQLTKLAEAQGQLSTRTSVPNKSLVGIPWRYALRCIDDLGLILRAEVVWSKPNGLPESVTDRVRRSHEDWFHFTLEPRYYSAVDEIHEASERRPNLTGGVRAVRLEGAQDAEHGAPRGINGLSPNPLGKLPGSVWTIPTEPLRVPDHLGIDHFAAFPSEWPRRIIRGWSPAGLCTACGEGRRPVVDKAFTVRAGYSTGKSRLRDAERPDDASGFNGDGLMGATTATITGYACACWPARYETDDPYANPPATVPALILDPFGGTGTVAMVARALGRHGIHVDLSADYNRLARWRITDLDQLAAVQGHARTKRQPDDQPTLLDHIPTQEGNTA